MSNERITQLEAKSGLACAPIPDTFLTSFYRAQAPYRGCAHGCRYCDGRAEKYYIEGEFERDIAVRYNLPQQIEADIQAGVARREFGAIAMGSGVTDIYQPIEAELGLTRRSLEALSLAGLPLVILTKSALILRDFDIIKRFPKALIMVTVTTDDAEKAAILEPSASLPGERLEVVRRAREAGFHAGVLAMPLCPGITDTDENTSSLFSACMEAGAQFIYPGGLTLRPGRQKDLFTSLVSARFPELENLYQTVYRENRASGMPVMDYVAPLMQRWDRALALFHVEQMVPHRIYRQLLSLPDSLLVLFSHMQNMYQLRGVDTRPLRAAAKLYELWLRAERTALRRKRSLWKDANDTLFPLTQALTEKLQSLRFEEIAKNAKLARLAESIIHDDAIFDYSSLSISK